MSREGYAQLDNDLDALSRRLEARIRGLKEAGRFPAAFEGPASEIRAHQRQLRDRVSDAIRSGHEWEIVKAELMRDYQSLFDNLLRLELRIDEEFASGQKNE